MSENEGVRAGGEGEEEGEGEGEGGKGKPRICCVRELQLQLSGEPPHLRVGRIFQPARHVAVFIYMSEDIC